VSERVCNCAQHCTRWKILLKNDSRLIIHRPTYKFVESQRHPVPSFIARKIVCVLYNGWQKSLNKAGQSWVLRHVFQSTPHSIEMRLCLWYNPPAPPPPSPPMTINQPLKLPDLFFAMNLGYWAPYHMWQVSLKCPERDCQGHQLTSSSKTYKHTVRRVPASVDSTAWPRSTSSIPTARDGTSRAVMRFSTSSSCASAWSFQQYWRTSKNCNHICPIVSACVHAVFYFPCPACPSTSVTSCHALMTSKPSWLRRLEPFWSWTL